MGNSLSQTIHQVLGAAIRDLRHEGIEPFTFAVYFDHEAAALSICVDTEANSSAQVTSQNAYSRKYFGRALKGGQLPELMLWQSNVGRNLSLGDFVLVNLARTECDISDLSEEDVVVLIRAVEAVRAEVHSLTRNAGAVVFCCSTANNEVGVVWS